MENLPFESAAMKWKSGVINPLPIAIHIVFKELYLSGKERTLGLCTASLLLF